MSPQGGEAEEAAAGGSRILLGEAHGGVEL
jgi:hypothetical protein